MILVVGSRNSSNSNRLREIGEELGKPSYLIDDASHLQPEWFDGVRTVGVTAGASAPETLVQGVLEGCAGSAKSKVSTVAGVAEDVRFRFPAAGQRRPKETDHGCSVEPGDPGRRLCGQAAPDRATSGIRWC